MTTALERPLVQRALPHQFPLAAAVAASPTKVLLSDGHHLFRSGLGALLDREEDLAVVAEAAGGEEAAAAAPRVRPAVAVLGLAPEQPDGPAAAQRVQQASPGTAVLLLVPALPRTAELRRALVEGAAGVLLKDVQAPALIAAVRELARGGRVYDPRLVLDVVRAGGQGSPLSRRELAVLGEIAEGATVREAAAALSLSPGTVRNYVSAAIAKTRARNRCDAIRIARECGWL
ncbi:response regulator transcription factor [Streptomyces sp. TLI_171]|uniref:response regulator transcription factor n=1 Tax=Streptomyces sp. TLI_171 TaxID=1938859 RepID=UPI000C191F47|nr:response regulator transcription factor [Streptomyces sp. TLI_171]RKE20750.1 two-component system response regulator DesR [Streptomyces sp. TLI_171]